MAKEILRPLAVTGERGEPSPVRKRGKPGLPDLPKSKEDGGSAAAPVRSYYSKPELGTDPDGLYDTMKQRGAELGKYGNALWASQRSHESDMQTLNEMMEKYEIIRSGYETNPTEETRAMLCEAMEIVTQQAKKAAGSKAGYGEMYEQYLPVLRAYQTAQENFQSYIQSQQEQLAQWKSTIRDAGSIEADLEEIDRQVLRMAAGPGTEAGQSGYLQGSAPVYGTPYGAKSQAPEKNEERDRLEAQRALLEEELEWSRYFKYNGLRENPDFEEKSRYIPTGSQYERYDYINKNGAAVLWQALEDQRSGAQVTGTDNSHLQLMNEEQVAVYNYLYATEGRGAANEYIRYIEPQLTQMQRAEIEGFMREFSKKLPITASAVSVGMAPLRGLSYLGQTMELLTRGRVDQNAGYNRFSYMPTAVRNQVSELAEEKWGPAGSYAYQLGMGLADSLMNRLTVGNNAALVRALMGTAAAADGTIAAKDRGLTDEQAFALGAIAGLAEAGIESLNVEEIFKPDMILDGIGKYVAKQAVSEGGEELLTNAVNFIFDCVYAKDQSEWQLSIDAYIESGLTRKEAIKKAVYDQLMSMGLDFFGGAISGAAMSGYHSANYRRSTEALGKFIGKQGYTEDDVRKLIDSGLNNAKDSTAYKLAAKMKAKLDAGKNLSDYDLGRLHQANAQAVAEEQESQRQGATGQKEGGTEKTLEELRKDYREGRISEAEFDAAMEEVMHMEELEEGTSVKNFDTAEQGPKPVSLQTLEDANENAGVTGEENGGYVNESDQRRNAGLAASQSGVRRAEGAGISDGIQIRNAGAGAGEQTGSLGSGAGRQGTQAYSATKAAIERQNTARNLQRRGLIEYSSSKENGLSVGTDTKSMLVYPESAWDQELRGIAERIRGETECEVVFTIGGMEFTSAGGEVYNVRGAYTGDKIFVQADETRTSATQIASHELFHEKTDRHGVKLLQDLKEEIETRFSPEEFDAVMDAYIDELWPLFGPTSESARDTTGGVFNRILEEMLADAYAGINAFGAHADRFTEEVNRHMDQLHLGKQMGQENGTEQPTGPPEDRYSYAGERAENADLEALAQAKEMRSAGVADETIRQQTGWFVGMDGKWRWEIDDSGMQYTSRGDLGLRERHPEYARYRELLDKANRHALELSDEALTPEEAAELQKLKNIWGGTFRKAGRITEDALPTELLSDYVKHDALFEAYPQLRKTRLRFANLPEGTRGRYDPEQDVITLSESLRGKPQDTLIHEIQHVIQKAEGFTGGATVEYWKQQRADIVETIAGARRNLDMWLDDIGYKEARRESLLAVSRREKTMEQHWKDMEEFKANSKYARQIAACESELAEFQRQYDEITHGMTAYEQYENTAGEIEARDAASRRRLTAEQRRSAEPARADDRTLFADGARNFAEVLEELDQEYAQLQQSYVDTEFSAEDLRENIRTVADMEPVAEITGKEFAKGEVDLITQVERYFDGLGNEVRNERLGDVILDRRGVKSDIAHGIGRKKAAAFAAVPDVIRNGLVVDYQENWKDRGYDTAVVAAPVRITGQEHIAGVIVVRSRRSNRFYLHEVMTTENGALPFKTGALKQGDSGGDAPSIFSILDRIRGVKGKLQRDARASIGDGESLRARMTTKERDILRGVENKLLRNVQGALGANRFADRSYMKNVIREASDAYLKDGTISEQEMDRLFEMAYEQGIMVDREFYDQYEDVRNHLRTVKVTLSEQDRSDIPDFEGFRNRVRYKVKISNDGGLPVDSAYHELNAMAPELFPNSIMHPDDQLTRMAEVADSLRINEQNLNDYYGPQAKEFRRDTRGEFDRAVWDAVGELQQIRRYRKDKEAAQEKAAQEEKVPTTPEEAMEAWAKLKDARKTYEKAMAKNLLTEEDEMQVGLLLQGKIQPEHLTGDPRAVKSIVAVYEAKREYQRITKLLAEYRKNIRTDLRKEADRYLETASQWKDKKAGILYSRETMQRNVEDIVPDKDVAKRVNERFFEPVRDAEAAAVKFKEEYREAMRKLNMSRKVQKGNLVSEAHAAQLYGEAMDNIRILEKARGRLKHRDGKSLEEWRGVVYKLWQENPGLDKVKIENALAEARRLYDEAFQKMNEVRVRWGYEPVNYRQGYFPHFQPGNGDGILAQFGRALGIDTQVDALPTTINGLTHTFKPGIQWFGNAQERLGFNTAYDLVEGFDRYIEGVASVIYQTENIQRLRALASQIRYRTSDEGIRKQVDAIYNDDSLSEDRKRALVEDVYKNGKYTLSNFVTEVEEYTNLLANKKSRLDRTVEAFVGRKWYTRMKRLESRVGANMIAGNITSSLTNFIPLTQASAQLSKREMLQGMWNTLKAYKIDDGITGKSAFLTNRRGSDPLVKTWMDKTSEVLSKPMELIDSFTSGSIVRAAYQQNLKRGLSDSEAMHQADIFASRVMAERSKGGMPTLFESKNPLLKLFTQFQLEVNNQFSEVFKDIPRANREKGLGALAMVLLQYFLGAWLFNNLYEKWIGRRPAMDPIDILLSAGQDLFGPDAVGIGEAGVNLANNILEELPFTSALTLVGIETDAGRIPVSSAIMNIHTLWSAATNKEWAAEKRWKEAQDELNKLAYVIPPFGGNQISKTWKGVKAYIEGGSYSVGSTGEDILQYPVYDDFSSLVQAMILGKSSLQEARNWVENGFDSFSAKETAMYQDMVEAGVDQQEAYEFLDSLRAVQATEETKKSLQMKAVLDADVPGEAKAIAYYGLLDKDDKNRGVMDALADLGADPGEAAETMIRLREANDLKAAEARALQAEVLRKSSLTESQKKEVVKSWLSKEELTEKGNLSDLGKFNLIMRLGYGVDEYMQYRKNGLVDELIEYAELPESSRRGLSEADWMDMKSRGISAEDYLELADEGMRSDTALEFLEDMAEAKDAAGDDGLEDIERWKVCVEFSDDTEDQMVALSTVMSQSRMTGVEIADTYGIAPADYVRFCEVQDQYDENGSGTLNQWEVENIINTEFPGLSNEQKAAMWQIMCVNTKSAKNNPFSTEIGQKVLDEKQKRKESEEEEEPEGLTLGNW